MGGSGSDGAKPRQVWDPRSGVPSLAGTRDFGFSWDFGLGTQGRSWRDPCQRGWAPSARLGARGEPCLSCHLLSLEPHPAPSTQRPRLCLPTGTRTSGRLSQCHQHRPPVPATMGGRKPKRSCGQPRGPNLAEDCARPPRHPVSPSCPTATGVSLPPGQAAPAPRGSSVCHLPDATKPPKDVARARHRARVPCPLQTPTPFGSKTLRKRLPLRPAPPWPPRPPPRPHHSGPTAAPPLPSSCITNFWEILHFKAVILVWTLLAPRRPSPPSLGFWFQRKVL